MRILYHHRTQAGDAQGIHIEEMMGAFKRLGHEVLEVALVRRGGGQGRPARNPYGLVAPVFRKFCYEILELAYSPIGYRMLSAAVRSFRPDFIYERYSLHNFAGVMVSKRFGIPLVLEVNSPLAEERRKYERLISYKAASRAERTVCAEASLVIAVTNVLRKMLVSSGVPPDRVVVMHNGVNRAIFNPAVSGEAIRRKYGMDGKVILGFVGWFRPWHGLQGMMQALIRERFWEDGADLMLVGDGPESGSLRKLAADAKVGRHVTFAGPVGRDEIPGYLAAMDIALQPAVTPYACPMKLIEYMALGKAIVAPDLENIRELVTDRRTALLFPDGNYGEMVSAARRLVRDRSLRLALGQEAARRVVEEGMTWEENARRVTELVAKRRPLCTVAGKRQG